MIVSVQDALVYIRAAHSMRARNAAVCEDRGGQRRLPQGVWLPGRGNPCEVSLFVLLGTLNKTRVFFIYVSFCLSVFLYDFVRYIPIEYSR